MKPRHLLPALLVGALALLGFQAPVSAATFCVNTAVSLQNALIVAAANGQDDEVQIVQGTYVGNFVYTSTEAQALSLRGGYTPGCSTRTLDPTNTMLDGNNHTGLVLQLSAGALPANFWIEGLTIRNGVGGLSASNGGGGEVAVENNHIRDNLGGGGVSLYATTAMLNNNDISGNATNYGGGGISIGATTATLTNNTITGNAAYHSGTGGGVYLYAMTATLTNNTLSGNTAAGQSGGAGGGVFLEATTATLTNNTLSGNTADSHYGGTGGGVYLIATTATLTNNTLSGNTAGYGGSYTRGGGMYLSATTATLTNNTLQGNVAGPGGGISVSFRGPATQSWVALYNNLFWQNQAAWNLGADFDIENSLASQVTLFANNFDWTPTIGFRVGTPIYLDASNLDKVDPLFVDATSGDLHLMPASPMIDTGYPATPDLPDFDLDGTPRVLGESVDIGAYEFDDGSDPKAILSLARAGTGGGTVTSAPTGIACGSDCFQAFDLDTVVTLTATPTDGNSVFEGWGGDADCADGQVTMSTHASCTATFAAVRQLTVARQGLGGGLVTSNPAGIDCGVACQAPFYLGERVQLTATPDVVSTFVGWSGDAACPNPLLDVNRSCTATFDPKLYRLYVFVAGSGGGTVTSAPAGIQCGTDCAEDYVANTRVTLTATPATTATFAGWTGPCTGIDPTCEVTMSQIQGVAAIFNLKTYPLTVTKAGTGAGTILSVPAGIDCGTACSWPYSHGTPVTLTATPAPTSLFTGWSGGGCSGTETCTVSLTTAETVSATFELKTYALTVTKRGTGQGIVTSSPAGIDCGPACSAFFDHGALVTLTAQPSAGSGFAGWSGAGCAGTAWTCQVPMTAAARVTATFVPLSLRISDLSQAEGTGVNPRFTFNVTLNAKSNVTISVKYATANGTATTADRDYASRSGTLTLSAGQTSRPITVLVTGDARLEADETFFVNLSAPSGATLADRRGQGTLINDD
ncbi:MAG: right-handed parallel beta-helix repeat-containing protein [Chromatiaceae bacterium]|nr:right-handed parallel beta-helix repeat-containing protein [Chromatiaceae bacterium]